MNVQQTGPSDDSVIERLIIMCARLRGVPESVVQLEVGRGTWYSEIEGGKVVYLNPDNMTRENKEALLEWATAEGLNSEDIFNNGRFSVHKGRVSGERFVKPTEGDKKVLAHKHRVVTQHFNVPQINPLPKVLCT